MNNLVLPTQSEETKEILHSWVTGTGRPEEVLQRLDYYDIEWYVTERGRVMVKVWQVGAEGFVSEDRMAEIMEGRDYPPEANALEWVSQHLSELQKDYAGHWIAVVGDRLVAASVDLPGLTAQLASIDVGTPLVTEIPTEPVVRDMAYATHLF